MRSTKKETATLRMAVWDGASPAFLLSLWGRQERPRPSQGLRVLTQHVEKERETNHSLRFGFGFASCKVLENSLFSFFVPIAVSSLLSKCDQIRLWKWRDVISTPKPICSLNMFIKRQVLEDLFIHTALLGRFPAPIIHSLILPTPLSFPLHHK